MKLNKVASPLSKLTTEMLKYGKDDTADILLPLFNLCLDEGDIVAEWRKGTLIFLYRKGDKKDSGNFRGITLLDVCGKLFTDMMQRRIMTWCEEERILSEYQCGFRVKRGTHHQLFT